MHGGEDGRQVRRGENFAAILRDAKRTAEESLRGSCTEADDQLRFEQRRLLRRTTAGRRRSRGDRAFCECGAYRVVPT